MSEAQGDFHRNKNHPMHERATSATLQKLLIIGISLSAHCNNLRPTLFKVKSFAGLEVVAVVQRFFQNAPAPFATRVSKAHEVLN